MQEILDSLIDRELFSLCFRAKSGVYTKRNDFIARQIIYEYNPPLSRTSTVKSGVPFIEFVSSRALELLELHVKHMDNDYKEKQVLK